MLESRKVTRSIWVLTAMCYAVLYLYPVIPYGAVITFVLAAAVFLLTVLEQRGRIVPQFTLYHGYMLLFTAFCFLSSLWAWDAEKPVDMGFSLLKTFLIISMLFSYYQRSMDIDTLLKSILWGGYFACAMIVLLYDPIKVITILMTGKRIDNSVINANTVGLIAAITAIVHLHFVLQNKKLCLQDILLLFAIVMVAISGSKKALLFLIAGYCMLFLLKSLDSKNASKSFWVTLCALVVITALLFMLPVFQRMRVRIFEMVSDLLGKGKAGASTNLRITYMKVGLEQFLKTPLFGIGMDCSDLLLETEMGRSTYLHCNYVELLACGGIVGTILFYFIYGYFIYYFWKYRKFRDQNYAILITLTALLLVTDVAIISYYSKETYFYCMVLFLYIQKLRDRKAVKE